MNILIVGSGGREHALTWAVASSPLVDKLYCAPGNGGMMELATCVPISEMDFPAIVDFCQRESIDLVIVGPEAPLAAGMVDRLSEEGILAFGPSAGAARLESSKGFMKDLCADYDIPTAVYKRFLGASEAKAYLQTLIPPFVIKADGLAAGKGVVIAETLSDGEQALDDMFGGSFGEAGEEVVIEEFLEGEEASFFVLIDGENCLPMATAQDHKRVGDGDTGPNTGGMGAYSPAPVMTPEMCDQVMSQIIQPTVQAMNELGTPYRGVLFAGLMITKEGPKLIEYNVRFGDPECQILMTRCLSDLVPIFVASAQGSLGDKELRWRDEAALGVVMATKGYPGAYEKGSKINGLEEAGGLDDVTVFHAGTTRENDQVLATGGRVLNITALGATITEARDRAYAAVAKVEWPEGFSRSDIGWRAVVREKTEQ